MRLSILIPSIPSRFDKAQKLYRGIMDMSEGMDIEVLLLVDNKKRTIGEKREALKNISQGKYFMFVDDDDSLLSVKEIYEATGQDVDVITFKQRCFNNDGSEFTVTFGLGNKIEHNNDSSGNYLACNRPPFHVCAWSNKFKKVKFPAISYGEDGVWSLAANKKAKSEYFIDKVVHSYNFDPLVTEASTESNQHWKNPNEPAKRIMVNFSTDQYKEGQNRLIQSVVQYGGDIPIIHFTPDDLECPSHVENPYAFKIYAIEKAKEMGYDQVLWLDASVVSVADPTPVFDWLDKHGIFLEYAGHWVGSWSPRHVLSYFAINRDEAMGMPMFAAGYCGFDFRNPISINFFKEWKESMLNGMFKGNWQEHRHDMTCGSIIANKQDLVKHYSPGGQFFSYIGEAYGEPKSTSVFHLIGI